MILGVFRDHFPRVTLLLPGPTDAIAVEFIVDTGFDGDLALPSNILRQLLYLKPGYGWGRRGADYALIDAAGGCHVRVLMAAHSCRGAQLRRLWYSGGDRAAC